MNALETLTRFAPKHRPLSLSLSKDFDGRWIGFLPIAFDGTPAECIEYAASKGFIWWPDASLLFGGRFEHPTEPDTLYPT